MVSPFDILCCSICLYPIEFKYSFPLAIGQYPCKRTWRAKSYWFFGIGLKYGQNALFGTCIEDVLPFPHCRCQYDSSALPFSYITLRNIPETWIISEFFSNFSVERLGSFIRTYLHTHRGNPLTISLWIILLRLSDIEVILSLSVSVFLDIKLRLAAAIFFRCHPTNSPK